MNILLKFNPKGCFSAVYLTIDETASPIGFLSIEGIEILKEANLLERINSTEVIENYFFSRMLIKDVKKYEYYYLKFNHLKVVQ